MADTTRITLDLPVTRDGRYYIPEHLIPAFPFSHDIDKRLGYQSLFSKLFTGSLDEGGISSSESETNSELNKVLNELVLDRDFLHTKLPVFHSRYPEAFEAGIKRIEAINPRIAGKLRQYTIRNPLVFQASYPSVQPGDPPLARAITQGMDEARSENAYDTYRGTKTVPPTGGKPFFEELAETVRRGGVEDIKGKVEELRDIFRPKKGFLDYLADIPLTFITRGRNILGGEEAVKPYIVKLIDEARTTPMVSEAAQIPGAVEYIGLKPDAPGGRLPNTEKVIQIQTPVPPLHQPDPNSVPPEVFTTPHDFSQGPFISPQVQLKDRLLVSALGEQQPDTFSEHVLNPAQAAAFDVYIKKVFPQKDEYAIELAKIQKDLEAERVKAMSVRPSPFSERLNALLTAATEKKGQPLSKEEVYDIVTRVAEIFQKEPQPGSSSAKEADAKARIATVDATVKEATEQVETQRAFYTLQKLLLDMQKLKNEIDYDPKMYKARLEKLASDMKVDEATIRNIDSMIESRDREERLKILQDQIKLMEQRLETSKDKAELDKVKAEMQLLLTAAENLHVPLDSPGVERMLKDVFSRFGLTVKKGEKFIDKFKEFLFGRPTFRLENREIEKTAEEIEKEVPGANLTERAKDFIKKQRTGP